MAEERCDMMMMMVLPTQHFQQEMNHISGYCLLYLIRKFTNITSNVLKGVLYYC